MSEIIYLVEFKLPNFPWTHWEACKTLEEAERALTARRKELAEPVGLQVRFRIIKHEILVNDVAGPIDVIRCAVGHNYAVLPSHPNANGAPICPHCLSIYSSSLKQEVIELQEQTKDISNALNEAQTRLAKIASIVLKFIMSADKTTSAEAFAAYEKYKEETKE
jgi:hypothetical protein